MHHDSLPIAADPLAQRLRSAATALLPGLGLTLGLALVATALWRVIGIAALSPLVLAMVLGIAVRNTLGTGIAVAPGIAFSLRRILRFAIVLLGFQLTATQLAQVGVSGLLVITLSLVGTFVFTKAMARLLGVDRDLGELIAAGTSICGASAVIACNSVTRGSDENVAYAIACVTVFGTISMLVFPILAHPLALAPQDYGIWVGSSVHEVAQVVAGAFALGEEAGRAGTVAKLSRVILLAPVILTLGLFAKRRAGGGAAQAPLPWFVFGFIAVVALNSVVRLPETLYPHIVTATTFLLTVALAAMGLETDIRKLRLKGLRPLVLGALAWLFISVLALGLVLLARG